MASGRSVLIVDDDPGIRRMMSLVLAGEGYDVRTAENGRQALDLLASWRPAVILLDLMMPVMDGWTFLAAQQADPILASIPVIVMSASGDLGASGPWPCGDPHQAVQGRPGVGTRRGADRLRQRPTVGHARRRRERATPPDGLSRQPTGRDGMGSGRSR